MKRNNQSSFYISHHASDMITYQDFGKKYLNFWLCGVILWVLMLSSNSLILSWDQTSVWQREIICHLFHILHFGHYFIKYHIAFSTTSCYLIISLRDKYISFFPNKISHILKTRRGVNFYLKKYLGKCWIFFFIAEVWFKCDTGCGPFWCYIKMIVTNSQHIFFQFRRQLKKTQTWVSLQRTRPWWRTSGPKWPRRQLRLEERHWGGCIEPFSFHSLFIHTLIN